MIVDGEKVDEYNSLITFTPINLSATLDGVGVVARISLFNSVALKIDDKLCVAIK